MGCVMVLADLEAVSVTRHLISATLTPEAYEISRLWALRRENSAMISAAILYYDEFGPRSKNFNAQKTAVREIEKVVVQREKSIAFFQDYIHKMNEEMDFLKAQLPDDPDL